MIYSLCDYTGNMLKPWRDAGFDTKAIDIQNGEDVFSLSVLADAEMVFAFPPCDDMAVSGARWMKGKGLKALARSIALVAQCVDLAEASGAPWMIENPRSTLASYWRPADHTFHPLHFSYFEPEDHYTKKTFLWVGNGFIMPDPKLAPLFDAPDPDYILKQPQSKARANIRSATPMGFAKAVFEANKNNTRNT